MSWKLSAIALVIFTAFMANVITKLEASFDVVASHATMAMLPKAYATAAPDKEDVKLAKDVDILRDSFLLSWIIGGCIPGACVGIWIRALTKMVEIAKTFGVSLFTSFCASPWVIKNYLTANPETCLLVGFLGAVGAWVAWEVILILANRIKEAARKRGWSGIKTEVLGGNDIAEPKPCDTTKTANG